MTQFMCQALDFSGTTWCGRCRLNWSTGVSSAPACKPKADPPIGMTEMYGTLTGEAKRVTDSQDVCIKAKFRTEPDGGEMRKAAVIMAAAQLIERVYRDERIMALLKDKPA